MRQFGFDVLDGFWLLLRNYEKKQHHVYTSLFAVSCFASTPVDYKPEIAPYITYLQTTKKINPTDYVIGLFDKYDIVILAETDHTEITQWDFFYELICDPRFISKVGNVFTEIGSVYLQPQLEGFLTNDTFNETAILQMMRNFMPDATGWDRNNYHDFLTRLYVLNKKLDSDRNIHLYFSDQPSNWDGLTTPYEYNTLYGVPPDDFINPRDRVMAMRVYFKFQDIVNSKEPRKKALVIMNSRHAFGPQKELDDTGQYGYIGQNVGRYLIQWMPNKVANVMLHTVGGLGEHLLQEGKWDAAFLYLNNPQVGFDFSGTPFGKDDFDYGQSPPGYHYQDIFTGMIFLKPLQEHMFHTNIVNYYDDDYKATVLQRTYIECGPQQYPDCFAEVQILWNDLEKHPEKFYGRLYDDAVLAPMYQWLNDTKKIK